MRNAHVDAIFSPETALFRYITLEQFMFLVESQYLSLTNVTGWDDTWEAFLGRIPAIDESGKEIKPFYSFYQELYGQCWSTVPESDAMWRIYSVGRTGIKIKTSVAKFEEIEGLDFYRLGRVLYFDSIDDLLRESSTRTSPFDDALYKRSAFDHEREVRLLVHATNVAEQFRKGGGHIRLPVDVISFIEGVTVDPRASNWYVETIVRYCARAGLNVVPEKSKLYEPEPHKTSGLVRRWVPKDPSSSA